MTSDGEKSAPTETAAGQAPAATSTPPSVAAPPPALAAAAAAAAASPEPAVLPPSPHPVSQQSPQQIPMSEQVYVKPKKGPVRRFVRSLISHLVFALIMVAAAFGWVYHEQIFNRLGDELCTADRLGGYMTKANAPQPSAPPVKLERATAGPAPAARPASESSPSSPVSAPMTTAAQPSAPASPPTAPAPADAATAAAAAAPSPTPTPAATATPASAPPLAEAKTAEAKPADAAMPRPAEPSKPAVTSTAAVEPPPAPAVTATRDAPVEAAPAAKPSGEATPAPAPKPAAEVAAPAVQAAVPAPAPEAPSLQALMSEWQTARQAYAADKAKSVEAYRKLVAKHPQVVALRGELGNVYYALGQMKEAAEQYYEAALLHLKGPEPELAACLVEVIKPFDAERAKSLEERTAGHPCPRGQSGGSPAKR